MFFGCLDPLSPVGFGRGRFEFCTLSCPQFLTTGGAEFCRLPNHSGLSDALSELANRYDRVESGFVIRDRVSIALMWHFTAP